MTGITRMPVMTRLKGGRGEGGGGLYLFLNKKFRDFFSRTHVPFFKDSNQ